MLRLTWRNLVARKLRLLMSTLAIVLGIGFLAGVMTFSSGLNATFDNIIKGSTQDAIVRTEGEVSFEASATLRHLRMRGVDGVPRPRTLCFPVTQRDRGRLQIALRSRPVANPETLRYTP